MNLLLLSDKELFSNVLFQTTKNRKKKLCVDKAIQETLKLCIVQHVEMKSVFTFQSKKFPVSTTVESAKPALTR